MLVNLTPKPIDSLVCSYEEMLENFPDTSKDFYNGILKTYASCKFHKNGPYIGEKNHCGYEYL
jgi:hypothetical protein